MWWDTVCGCSPSCPATSLKRTCSIATWCVAAVRPLATNFSTLVSIRATALARIREEAVRIGPHRYCGIGFVFSVVATLAPSGAEAVVHQSSGACGTNWCIYTSHFALGRLFGGNTGDDVQSVAGRVLGRILHLNGCGMEPRVLFASRRSTCFADLCTFLQNMHVAQRLVSFDCDMR